VTSPTLDLVALHGVPGARVGGVSDETYAAILRLLEYHMVHERVEDLDGILETLVAEPLFVMEYMPFNLSDRWWWSRKRWHGHDAVVAFYKGLFRFFQGFHVDVTRYVISPRGAVDAYRIGGRLFARWLNFPRAGIRGIPLTLTMAAFLPYDATSRKLGGERVYITERSALKNL
jgi:hypothetical protein